jgi:hypothetical protein
LVGVITIVPALSSVVTEVTTGVPFVVVVEPSLHVVTVTGVVVVVVVVVGMVVTAESV